MNKVNFRKFFALLLTISYRNSQINEKFNNVQTLKRELSTLQKENEQLKVSIANGLNNNYIEVYGTTDDEEIIYCITELGRDLRDN